MFALCSCSLDEPLQKPGSEAERINLGGEIEQAYLTRADDSGFADKDEIGIYVVDYADGQPGVLKNSGNRADNVRHTFDEASWKWIPARGIYWKDSEGRRVKVDGHSPTGFASDLGAVFKLGPVALYAGASTINFRYFDMEVGLGFNF